MKILQLQYIDKVVDVCCRVQTWRRQPSSRSCSSLSSLDKVVDMPVVGKDRCRGRCPGAVHRRLWTSCDHAATLVCDSGSATDSVHRWSRWTFQFATEVGTLLSTMVVMAGFFGLLWAIFRAPRSGDAGSLTPRRSATLIWCIL